MPEIKDLYKMDPECFVWTETWSKRIQIHPWTLLKPSQEPLTETIKLKPFGPPWRPGTISNHTYALKKQLFFSWGLRPQTPRRRPSASKKSAFGLHGSPSGPVGPKKSAFGLHGSPSGPVGPKMGPRMDFQKIGNQKWTPNGSRMVHLG